MRIALPAVVRSVPIALLLLTGSLGFAESNGTSPEAAPAPAATAPAPTTSSSAGAPAVDSPAPSTVLPTTSSSGTPDPTPTAASHPAAKSPFDGFFLLMLAVPLVLMWFMATRGQKKEEKRMQSMRAAIKRGDQVVTVGGAHGEVLAVGESTIDLKLGKSDNAPQVTFNKSAIATVAGVDVGKAK